MKFNRGGNGVLIMLFVVITTFLIVIFAQRRFTAKREVISLDAVEFREYEGNRLSSVSDFGENSIKGVQCIDTGISFAVNYVEAMNLGSEGVLISSAVVNPKDSGRLLREMGA